MKKQYIGEKQIKQSIMTEEKTPSGIEILKIVFEDDTEEYFSKLMYEAIVSNEKTPNSTYTSGCSICAIVITNSIGPK